MSNGDDSVLLDSMLQEEEGNGTPAEQPTIASSPPLVGWELRRVSPTSELYLFRDDTLRIEIFNSFSGLVVTIAGRFLRADGIITPFSRELRPPADRSLFAENVFLGEGFLLGVVVSTSSPTLKRGQTWVKVYIRRNIGGTEVGFTTLIQDYVHARFTPAFPQGTVGSPIVGPGQMRSIGGTSPAPGNDFAEAVPTNARWRLISGEFAWVTAAGGSSRRASMIIDNGAVTILQTYCAAIQPPGSVRGYTFGEFNSWQIQIDDRNFIPLPANMILDAGWRFRSAMRNLAAGDIIGTLNFMVEELIQE